MRAITIDGLSKTVGASRGSFYWHFKNRQELIDAVLDEWEAEHTTALLPVLEPIADPTDRLRSIIDSVYAQAVDPIEIALAAEGGDPLVADAYARVTKRRLDAVTAIFTELGFDDEAAAQRAWWTYALYVGHHLLGETRQLHDRRPAELEDLAALLTHR